MVVETSDKNSTDFIKYMLGGDGLDVLEAIGKGADRPDIISLLSGVSIKCVEGRMPILVDLELVQEKDSKYTLKKKGTLFLHRHEMQSLLL